MGEAVKLRFDVRNVVDIRPRKVLKKVRSCQVRAVAVVELVVYQTISWIYGTRSTPGSSGHVLIAAPGGGNIGDQAMLESFIANVDGPVRIVVRSEGDYNWQSVDSDAYEVVVLPSLLYGNGPAHLRDFVQYLRQLSDTKSVSVIGADIMDGAYNANASVRRSNLVSVAAGRGLSARILGFSWNDRPHPAAGAALKRATSRGVQLFLRDPLSFDRARQDGLSELSSVSDMVFARRLQRHSSSGRAHDDQDLVLVNASALINRRVDQVGTYETVIHSLIERGYKVVLLPHVIRPNGDDLDLLRTLHARVNREEVELVDRLLSPAEVSALCQRAKFVITGRMHLGILALRMGVPPIILATQGKVEGLFELFGIPELAVNPHRDLAVDLLDRTEYVVSRLDDLREIISLKLPEVVELSRVNFEGLK